MAANLGAGNLILGWIAVNLPPGNSIVSNLVLKLLKNKLAIIKKKIKGL
jgi:hypothetical protein